LDGVNTHREDSVQIKQLAKLYLLTRRFKLPTMQLLIRQKLISGFPHGYPYKTMLVFCWTDIPGDAGDGARCSCVTGHRGG
jgi:hypothetical protein